MENTEKSRLIKEKFFGCIHYGLINEKDLIQIFEHLLDIVNLKDVTTFAKENGISYNGVQFRKNHRIYICGKEYLIDNK